MTAGLPVPSRCGAALRRSRVALLAAACCALVLALAGCRQDAQPKDFRITGLETLADQRLADAISRYYTTEASRKWSALYDLRHPAFRRQVSRKAFVAAMRRDWKLWHFNGVEVEGLRGVDIDGVSIGLVFDEVVTGQDAALAGEAIWFKRPWWDDKTPIGATTRSFSSWIEVKGRWYPVLSGLRPHIAYDLQAID